MTTDDARKAMEAWLAEPCPHVPQWRRERCISVEMRWLRDDCIDGRTLTDEHSCLADLFARLETVERRRWDLFVRLEMRDHMFETAERQLNDKLDRLREVEADNARLREALGDYGRHEFRCAVRMEPDRDRPCDCGLAAALAGTGDSDGEWNMKTEDQ